MAKELDTFLDKFSLQVAGGKVEPATTYVEKDTALVQYEQQLVKQLKDRKIAAYGLDKPEGIAYTQALGRYSLIKLRLPILKNGVPAQVFATITPDTDYQQDKLRIAYLGRIQQGSIWIPEHLDPQSPKVNMDNVRMYLSAANQLGTVGDHQAGTSVPIVDPRHLLNAMAEFNVGSQVQQRIEATVPQQRAHISDTWETQRGMLPLISAQDHTNPRNDLVWAPISFTGIISEDKPQSVAIVLTPDILDQDVLDFQNAIVPQQANIPRALQELQNMSFVTILGKRQEDNLAQEVERKIV